MDPNLTGMPAQYRSGEDGRADIARKKKEGMEMLLALSDGKARSTSSTDATALRPHRIRRDADLKLSASKYGSSLSWANYLSRDDWFFNLPRMKDLARSVPRASP